METVDAARAEVRIWYNDRDISADVAGVLSSFEYTDFGSGKIDDIDVSFVDPDDRWCHGWYPDEGARLKAEIVWHDGANTRRLPCGTFVIDAPTYASPGIITLKATSASISTSMRRQARTRQWKQVTLKQLADTIAGEHNTTLLFVGPDTPPLSKLEQKTESDIAFLLTTCQKEGYALKVDSNQLVIYRHQDMDTADPVVTLQRRGGTVLDWNFSRDSLEAYKACKVVYTHPDRGTISATYAPANAPANGQVLEVREYVHTTAEAMRRARARYDLANRNRMSGNLTLVGDTRIVSGVTVQLVGWGLHDGRYSVDEAKHSVGGGYRTTIKAVKV